MTCPVWLCMVVLFCLSSGFAQQAPAASVSGLTAPVPTLINFGGTLTDGNGKALTGIVGVTFYLYKDQQSSTPLWMETQNVQPDKSGRYSVMLGSTTSQGLPTDIFVSGEARWLAVQPQGQPEQPRTLLLSVPYALKAADAETVGGLPPSAFVLAAPTAGSGGTSPATSLAASPSSLDSTPLTVSGVGTAQFVPLWTPNGSTLGNSVLFQSGTGSTANVGINTNTPSTTLDVNGPVTVRGVNLPAAPGVLLSPLGTATPTQGFNSTALDLEAQSFNTAIDSGANYVFRWQAEPTGNDTSNTGATLHLLYGVPQSISETGLSINKQGILTFAPKQTFPGAGGGTVTSVGSGAGLTGGPITSSGTLSIAAGGITNTMLANPSLAVSAGTDLTGGGRVALGSTITLNLDTTKVPQLGAANTFAGNQTVNGTLKANAIGVGAGTPAAPLDIVVPNTGAQNLLLFGDNVGGSGDVARFIYSPGTSFYPLTLSLTSNEKYARPFSIMGGNVGIGTAAPDSLLSVNGSADKPGGGSWGTFSDRRLKTLKGDFKAGLDQVLKLNPVRYRYKDDNTMGIHDVQEHVGLVAQEVQPVIPEAVTENSKGYLLVNNDPIIWAMLNAIKEQQKQIAAQQSQIRKQQQLMTTQQHEIVHLSRKVGSLESSLRSGRGEATSVLASRMKTNSASLLR